MVIKRLDCAGLGKVGDQSIGLLIDWVVQDEEKWTPMSPDTLSGPELENITARVQNRILEVRIPKPQFLKSWIF
jgi:hypothetical protein